MGLFSFVPANEVASARWVNDIISRLVTYRKHKQGEIALRVVTSPHTLLDCSSLEVDSLVDHVVFVCVDLLHHSRNPDA